MARPKETWYVPKAINDIDRILDALEAVKDMDEMIWNRQSGNQKQFMEKIKSINDYGGTPSPMAGRNWMATFQFFGLIYPKVGDGGKKYISITQMGKSLNEFDRNDFIRVQLLKLQFPNPYQIKHMARDIQMFPYWTLLKLIHKLQYITQEEIAYFALWIKNHTEIDNFIRRIKIYRRTKRLPRYIQRLEKKQNELLLDYASRVRLYFCYTDLLDFEDNKIILNHSKLTLIDTILSSEPIVNPDFADKTRWNEWFEYYGKGKKKYREITGRLTKNQYKAQKLIKTIDSILSKQKLNRLTLKRLSQETKINIKDIDKIINNPNLIEQFPDLKSLDIKGQSIYRIKGKKIKIAGQFSDKIDPYLKILESAVDSNNWLQFEDNVKEIFKVLQFDTEQLGGRAQGPRDVPDTILKSLPSARSRQKPWAILIDAKSRKKSFGLDTNSRRAMIDYANKFIKNMKYRTYYLEGVLFVSSNFSGNVKSKCTKIYEELKDNNPSMDIKCSCITAKSLLYLLDIFLNEPTKITHEKILELLKLNDLITNRQIDKIKDK